MLWVKAFHIIAVVCWFAGLFYLPRLFVYHVEAAGDAVGQARLDVMARKLYRGIMWPSMLATLALGGWLLAAGWAAWRQQGWVHAKLTLVALLVVYHLTCGHYRIALAKGRCTRSSHFFRWFNELPVLALFGCVIFVVVKPF